MVTIKSFSHFIKRQKSITARLWAVWRYDGNKTVACAGLKRYSDTDVEIKRVWVEPEYRGKHIARDMMGKIEDKAREFGYKRTILQTREIMKDAVGLYERIGYSRIENYPPYDTLLGAICMAKEL